MNSKPPKSGVVPQCLPKDFFDTDKKSKRVQEDELAKELEQFEREMAALEAESQQNIKEEFDKLQEDKNIDELDQQMEQWKRMRELEKRAEELQSRSAIESAKKRLKRNDDNATREKLAQLEDDISLDDVEDFEDKLCDWRSRGL